MTWSRACVLLVFLMTAGGMTAPLESMGQAPAGSMGQVPAQGGASPEVRPVVLLDPARGGGDGGARFPDGSEEREIVLNLAIRLRPLLNARGFDVVMTREADAAVSNDARAAIANTAHPLACVLLHATPAGRGVHLYTSALKPASPGTGGAVLWNEAQAPFAGRSLRLSNELASAFSRSRIPVSTGATWMHPLDNMQCAAVAIEVGPSRKGAVPSNSGYQTDLAAAIAGALLAWRSEAAGLSSPGAQP